MLCPKCGSDTGNQIRECDECQKVREAKDAASQANASVRRGETAAGGGRHGNSFGRTPRLRFVGILLLLFFLAGIVSLLLYYYLTSTGAYRERSGGHAKFKIHQGPDADWKTVPEGADPTR